VSIASALDRAAFAVFLTAVAFAPLALGSTYEWSILGLRLLVAAALALLATSAAARSGWPAPPRLLTIALLAYLATVLISFVGSPSPHGSWQATQLIVTCGLGFFLAAGLVTSARRAAWFLGVMLATALAMGTYGLLQAAGYGVTPSMSFRVSSTYFNANHYAGFLDLTLPLALAVALLGRRPALRLVAVALAVLLFANVALAASRGAWIALTVVSSTLVFGWLVAGLRREGWWVRPLSLLLVTLGIGAGSWWAVQAELVRGAYLKDRAEGILHDLTNLEDFSRVVILRAGAQVTMERPLIGVGPGNFVHAVTAYRPAVAADAGSSLMHRFVNYAHNDYLQVASESGLISLAFFLLFWSAVLVSHSQRAPPLRWGLTAGVAALLIHGLVDGNLTVIPSNAFLAYVAAGVLHARWR
jgi:O-antigen ligase